MVLDSYARLSWKPDSGDLAKIADQHRDNSALIGRLGATLGEELSDGASARKRGTRRPGWDEILERLRSGASHGVVVWNTDRMLRAPRDLEVLIDHAASGFRIFTVAGSYDLANAEHRFILRIQVAQAAKESDDKSRRIVRRFEGQRERGVLHPRARRFGWPGRDLTWTPSGGKTDEDRPMVSAELVARSCSA